MLHRDGGSVTFEEMKMHNILYYNWGEVTYEDASEVLKKLGHHVITLSCKFEKYDNDQKFIDEVIKNIRNNNIDCIFSFNYFPDISRAANECQVKYISWVYDSPHRVLDSITLSNKCNSVYLFDYALYQLYAGMGINTVNYLPLASNVNRVQQDLEKYFAKNGHEYKHDITFLGNMKNDEHNFFEQINYLPPYIKGYIDAAMEAQIQIFGMDLVSVLMRDDICQEIFKLVNINMGSNYRECRKEVLISMIQKQITAMERKRILTVLGENYKVDHYADKKMENLPVNYMGYASYVGQMSEIFATSKINLNISLRSIQTGIPLRVIDILGAGGFCITNFQAELMNYFENGKSIVWYESYEDLFDKIAYYLEHDEERQAIAKAGHEIVKNQFNYEVAFNKILDF